MRGFARPSRWSISTSTAIAWLLKGRSVCGGRKTASRDQINHQGCQKRPGFRLESDRKLQLSLRFLGRYEIRHLCRGSLAPEGMLTRNQNLIRASLALVTTASDPKPQVTRPPRYSV